MCSGGLAKAKTFIEQQRAKGEPMLVLNAGDDFVGSEWDHYYKGKATAHFMNQLGIDAMVSLIQHVESLPPYRCF